VTDIKVRLRGDTKNPTPFLKGTRESMDGISILWRPNSYLFRPNVPFVRGGLL